MLSKCLKKSAVLYFHAACHLALTVIVASTSWNRAIGDQPIEATQNTIVPELRGSSARLVSQLLTLNGLRVEVGTFFVAPQKWRNDILPNVIYLQSHRPETIVPEKTRIGTWKFEPASKQQKIVQMPDLRNKDVKEAEAILRRLNLSCTLDRSAVLPDNTVADQYPRRGQSVYEGTMCFLIVVNR